MKEIQTIAPTDNIASTKCFEKDIELANTETDLSSDGDDSSEIAVYGTARTPWYGVKRTAVLFVLPLSCQSNSSLFAPFDTRQVRNEFDSFVRGDGNWYPVPASCCRDSWMGFIHGAPSSLCLSGTFLWRFAKPRSTTISTCQELWRCCNGAGWPCLWDFFQCLYAP